MRLPQRSLRVLGGALLLCAVANLLSGCVFFQRRHRHTIACTEKPFTGNAEALPPLNVPPGLSPPDTRNGVKIPALKAPAHARSKSLPCLDQPPSYGTNEAKPPRAKSRKSDKEGAATPSAPAPSPPAPNSPAPPAAPGPTPPAPAPSTGGGSATTPPADAPAAK